MAPTLDGTYEGLPPTLMELVARDRRWAQGNLQHLSIVGAGGITGTARVHLAMGALSYLVSAIWASSLVVGIMLSLQSRNMTPDYFPDAHSLFLELAGDGCRRRRASVSRHHGRGAAAEAARPDP